MIQLHYITNLRHFKCHTDDLKSKMYDINIISEKIDKLFKNSCHMGKLPPKIIGGIKDENPLSEEEVKKIATLPTLNEARANIVGILTTPAQKIMSILLAPGSKIAILALAKSKKT